MKSTGLNSRDSWLATIFCTIISLLTMIPARLSGLLFVEILERYDTDRTMASYPLFLSMLVRCSGGPLTGYCGERFGLYTVILAGSVLSAVGVGVVFFAQEMVTLIFFLGLVYGMGLTFSLVLFPQVLKQHFDKNLAFAISMSMFGACFGGFVSPPLIKWIFQLYGVSGTFLIMSGVMLNAVPAAMFLKYLKPKKPFSHSKPLVSAAPASSKTATRDELEATEGKEEYYVCDSVKTLLSSPPERLTFENNSVGIQKHVSEDLESTQHNDRDEQNATLLTVESNPTNTIPKSVSNASKTDPKSVSKQRRALQSLAIFLDITFLAILMTQSAEVIIQMLTLTTVLDYSRDKGIDRSYEVHLLMALPLAEVFGRVVLSMLIDRNYISRLHFTVVSFNVLAAIVLLMVWARTFLVLLTGVVAFGLVTSGLLSVFPMLVFQFMEPKHYIMAMASRFFLYGPMSFLCAPLIGYFRGEIGSYDWVYYLQAILSLVCALLTMLLPYFANRRDRMNEKKETGSGS